MGECIDEWDEWDVWVGRDGCNIWDGDGI